MRSKSTIHVTKSGNPKCPFQVAFVENNKRIIKKFKDEFDAIAFAKQKNAENNTPDVLKLSDSERVVFSQIRQLCAKYNVALETLPAILMQIIPSAGQIGHNFDDAIRDYLADLQKRAVRPATIRGYVIKLNYFKRIEKPQDVAEITQNRAEAYLGRVAAPVHHQRVLRAFYAFCVSRKWLSSNPFTTVEYSRKLGEKELPPVIPVTDFVTFLASAPTEWQPTIALMAFCGIRPNEIITDGKTAMRIADIDFDAKKIIIRAEIAKTRTSRIFTPPANIWQWLKPLRGHDKSDFIAPASYEVWRRIKTRSGITLSHDILRHSFASYGFHYLGAERTVEILGHVGGFSVFAKHYKGLATPEAARRYFTIKPAVLNKKKGI